MKIALVSAKWHADLVQKATQSCLNTLQNSGVSPSDIDTFEVPGSLEIPLFALKVIQTQKYDAVIGFGWVVDGGIYSHEFVAHAILQGLMKVQLETGIPVFSCILSPQSFQDDNNEHLEFFKNHLLLKGQEAAQSCLAFLKAMQSI